MAPPTIHDVQSVATKIRENVGKVIVGKGDVVDLALVARAATVGLPCRPAETPYEFLPRLTQKFPEQTDDIHAITEAYVAVHYGELDAPMEQVNIVRAAWARIEKTIRPTKTSRLKLETEGCQ